MKRYRLEVVVEEGNDEFWEDLTRRGVTGCDEITEAITEAAEAAMPGATVRLVSFEDP